MGASSSSLPNRVQSRVYALIHHFQAAVVPNQNVLRTAYSILARWEDGLVTPGKKGRCGGQGFWSQLRMDGTPTMREAAARVSTPATINQFCTPQSSANMPETDRATGATTS